MDERAIHCLLTSVKKDSLIASQKRLLVIKDSMEVHLEKSISILTASNESKDELLRDYSQKLNNCRKSKRIAIIGAVVGFVGGYFVSQSMN